MLRLTSVLRQWSIFFHRNAKPCGKAGPSVLSDTLHLARYDISFHNGFDLSASASFCCFLQSLFLFICIWCTPQHKQADQTKFSLSMFVCLFVLTGSHLCLLISATGSFKITHSTCPSTFIQFKEITIFFIFNFFSRPAHQLMWTYWDECSSHSVEVNLLKNV